MRNKIRASNVYCTILWCGAWRQIDRIVISPSLLSAEPIDLLRKEAGNRGIAVVMAMDPLSAQPNDLWIGTPPKKSGEPGRYYYADTNEMSLVISRLRDSRVCRAESAW
jgi:hypothetical protein